MYLTQQHPFRLIPVGNGACGPLCPAGATVLGNMLVPDHTQVALPIDVSPVPLSRKTLSLPSPVHLPRSLVSLNFSDEIRILAPLVTTSMYAADHVVKYDATDYKKCKNGNNFTHFRALTF